MYNLIGNNRKDWVEMNKVGIHVSSAVDVIDNIINPRKQKESDLDSREKDHGPILLQHLT